jgi:hypothetical protein
MHSTGLKAGVSWFIGFPGETPAEAASTFDFVNTRRDRIAISVYAGTFMLGADTLVFANPERYGIEIFRSETGGWDYRYKDGREYFDRKPLDEAFRARSDLPLLCHGAYLMYACNKVEDLEKTTGLGRFGPIARECIEDDTLLLQPNPGVILRNFGYDAFKPRPAEVSRVRREPVDIAYLLKNGASYVMDEADRKLCSLVDGRRPLGEVVRGSGLDGRLARERLARMVDRAILLAPRDRSEAPPAAVSPAGASTAAA